MFMLLFLHTFLDQSSLTSVIEPLTFSFPSFDPSSCTNGSLICMGSVTGGNGYLSLTPEPKSNSSVSGSVLEQVGRVLFHHPVLAWPASISTTFTVRISPFPNYNVSGDGMAFVIAQDNSSSPPSSVGSYLGIMDPSTQGGIVRQLAVELDTYKNEWDPDENHIGIDTISIITPVAAKSLNSTGIDLKSGREIKVKIDYHGWKKRLEVSIAYSGDKLVSVLNQSIEMADVVPSSVFIGFTAATGKVPESHQVLDWTFTTIPLPYLNSHVSKDEKIKNVLLIVIPIIMGLVIVAICFLPSFQKVLRTKKETVKKKVDIEIRSRTAANVPKMFTRKLLAKATHNFSKENLLGTGGFGSVYKGTLQNPPTTVAVKKISATSKQGEKEYFAEICTIGRLRHKNIVQLQGWCHEGEHLLLVYEYMPNGSLDRYIGKRSLDWETRFKILTGLASALLYLHEDSGNPVVHRDVKPNNVMLDEDFNAHLGDFGLARLLQNDASVTTMLAGTPGYLAPEVGFTGKSTPESDVYSFGMVVIEVVCGRRSKGIMEENSLVDYVWNSYGQNELLECVDRRLEGQFDEEQVKRTLTVGLACLHPDSTQRPKIRKVVQIFLNSDEPLMDLPESRPSAVYVSVSSSASTTTTGIGSKSGLELLSVESSPESYQTNEIVLQFDH
ncbi:L-type lectin-domain containing receptor kinase IX.1-like [Herrania umbratica]|uniref:non-specific serine/threonine protein kinase n=1 Tax=Herrania umbratica TaxID=108875 RepID=A0A6J0ZSB4_9ROSI|nr:L-type lectin-domain containing receptor kinase IX.1-like [Herrania umbratica]